MSRVDLVLAVHADFVFCHLPTSSQKPDGSKSRCIVSVNSNPTTVVRWQDYLDTSKLRELS